MLDVDLPEYPSCFKAFLFAELYSAIHLQAVDFLRLRV